MLIRVDDIDCQGNCSLQRVGWQLTFAFFLLDVLLDVNRAQAIDEPAGQPAKLLVEPHIISADDEPYSPACAALNRPLTVDERLVLISAVDDRSKFGFPVFAARSGPVAGFVAIAAVDVAEQAAAVRVHWQRVLQQRLQGELQQLGDAERMKVQAAIDLTIARIIRDYVLLVEYGYLQEQPPEWAPLHDRVKRAGSLGPWRCDPLLDRIIQQVGD